MSILYLILAIIIILVIIMYLYIYIFQDGDPEEIEKRMDNVFLLVLFVCFCTVMYLLYRYKDFIFTENMLVFFLGLLGILLQIWFSSSFFGAFFVWYLLYWSLYWKLMFVVFVIVTLFFYLSDLILFTFNVHIFWSVLVHTVYIILYTYIWLQIFGFAYVHLLICFYGICKVLIAIGYLIQLETAVLELDLEPAIHRFCNVVYVCVLVPFISVVLLFLFFPIFLDCLKIIVTFFEILRIIYVATVAEICLSIGILFDSAFTHVVSLCSSIFFNTIAPYMKMMLLPQPANEMMYYLIRLYADVVCIGVCILFGICTLLLYIYITNTNIHSVYTIRNYRISGGTEALIDVLLFVLPTFIICYILTPTLIHLYRYDVESQTIASAFTIDVIGNQWYWQYKYNFPRLLYCKDLELLYDITELVIEIESRMSEDIVERLHSVDNVLVIPKDTAISIDVTSMDVIHSFGVPQLGIKIDAIPGRYQHGILYAEREGIYYGHCYELCGTYHGFMPIIIKVVSTEEFVLWCLQMLHLNMAGLLLHALFGI